MNKDPKFNSEFEEFMSAEAIEVPSELKINVFTEVHQALNPSPFLIFAKISLTHLFVGLFTLLLCPQFGTSFTSSSGLMGYLMKYGEAVCMLGCGALFLSLSLLVVSLFVLNRDEMRVLRSNRIGHIGILSTLSLTAFIAFGLTSIEMAGIFWLLGALVGGVVSLELGWKARTFFRGILYASS